MTVADRIKKLRECKNMTQEELAHMIGLKDRSSIAKIEKSGNDITLKYIEKLAPALGCTIRYLMVFDSQPLDIELQELQSIVSGLDAKRIRLLLEYARLLKG